MDCHPPGSRRKLALWPPYFTYSQLSAAIAAVAPLRPLPAWLLEIMRIAVVSEVRSPDTVLVAEYPEVLAGQQARIDAFLLAMVTDGAPCKHAGQSPLGSVAMLQRAQPFCIHYLVDWLR
jgi:hypothetical protein